MSNYIEDIIQDLSDPEAKKIFNQIYKPTNKSSSSINPSPMPIQPNSIRITKKKWRPSHSVANHNASTGKEE